MKIIGAKIKVVIMQGNIEIFILHYQMSALLKMSLEFVVIKTKATSFVNTCSLGHSFLHFISSYLSWMSKILKTEYRIKNFNKYYAYGRNISHVALFSFLEFPTLYYGEN